MKKKVKLFCLSLIVAGLTVITGCKAKSASPVQKQMTAEEVFNYLAANASCISKDNMSISTPEDIEKIPEMGLSEMISDEEDNLYVMKLASDNSITNDFQQELNDAAMVYFIKNSFCIAAVSYQELTAYKKALALLNPVSSISAAKEGTSYSIIELANFFLQNVEIDNLSVDSEENHLFSLDVINALSFVDEDFNQVIIGKAKNQESATALLKLFTEDGYNTGVVYGNFVLTYDAEDEDTALFAQSLISALQGAK